MSLLARSRLRNISILWGSLCSDYIKVERSNTAEHNAKTFVVSNKSLFHRVPGGLLLVFKIKENFIQDYCRDGTGHWDRKATIGLVADRSIGGSQLVQRLATVSSHSSAVSKRGAVLKYRLAPKRSPTSPSDTLSFRFAAPLRATSRGGRATLAFAKQLASWPVPCLTLLATSCKVIGPMRQYVMLPFGTHCAVLSDHGS